MEQRLADLTETTRPATTRGGTGAWSWIMQRLTGAFLIFFLGAHFWLLHFEIVGQQINFERVSDRLSSPFFIFLDVGLLGFALYHALNGARAVIMDTAFGPKIDRPLSLAFWAIGIVTFVFGINALLPFITGEPLFSR
jgi:succinate dehydrogenase / fumarate reductase, membrane anchor subunit